MLHPEKWLQKHPKAIFIQQTTGCNAKCVNCPHPFTYGAQGTHQTGNMSDETWEIILGQIADAGFSGQVGLYLQHEPLLVRNLASRIKDVNEKTRGHVVMSTNAALLTEERRRELIDARPRTVHININSADKAQYEDMMKLDWALTQKNAHAFIEEAKDRIEIQINCPVLPGVDTQKLVDEFPTVKVNIEFWANSRGGLLDDVTVEGKDSRFKLRTSCVQPTQNFNILWDGSVILCCIDWNQETKPDFPNIRDVNMFEIYNGEQMETIRKEFRAGCYERYKMCSKCADEMGFNKGRPVRLIDDVTQAGRDVKEKVTTLFKAA